MTRLVRWKTLILASLAVVAIGMAILVGGGWYVSEVIKDKMLTVNYLDPPLDLEVGAVGRGQITLRKTPLTDERSDWRNKGIYGLESEAGYDQVGPILDQIGQEVVREFYPIVGTPRVGDMVRLDHFAFPGDTQTAFGITYEEISFQSSEDSIEGDFPAWYIAGPNSTWVIILHGRRVGRQEGLRILPTVTEAGLPSLTISYRNDREAPKALDRFYRYGQTEWMDLEGAARYALSHGAEQLILVGYSYGGAIIMNFLYQSPEVEKVRGIILDAPMLDLNAILDREASKRNIPAPLVVSGKTIAGIRFEVEWSELNYLRRADELTVPILLFHGDDDEIVPVGTSDKLCELRPDLIFRYVRCADTAHARCWNTDRTTYEETVGDFLRNRTHHLDMKEPGSLPCRSG